MRRRHDQAPIRSASEGHDGTLDLSGVVAHVDRAHLHPERRRDGLDCAELAGSGCYRGIPNYGHSRHTRSDLLEQLRPFAAQAVFERGETGSIATGPRQAAYETGTDRVNNLYEYDRYSASGLQ